MTTEQETAADDPSRTVVWSPASGLTYGVLVVLLAWLAGFLVVQAVQGSDPDGEGIPFALIALGLLASVGFAVFAALGARARMIVDDTGVTTVGPFRRRHVEWREITGWEVESTSTSWVVRAFIGRGSSLVYEHRPLYAAAPQGVGYRSGRYRTPPDDAPRVIRRAFAAVRAGHRAWRRRED